MLDWLRITVLGGIAALWLAVLCLGFFAYQSAASRNLGLATATLAAATLLFSVQALFELQSSTFRNRFTAEYTIDRGNPSIRQWKYPSEISSWRVSFEDSASRHVAETNPAAFTGDRVKLTQQMAVYSLVLYLLMEQRDWQAERIRLQGQFWAEGTIGPMSPPGECASISAEQMRETLTEAGNVFAGANVVPPTWHICLPPGSSVRAAADSLTVKNPFCEIVFTVVAPTGVTFMRPGSEGEVPQLENGDPKLETRLSGVETRVQYDAVRAPHRDMPKYQDWARRVVEGARQWFQGAAPSPA